MDSHRSAGHTWPALAGAERPALFQWRASEAPDQRQSGVTVTEAGMARGPVGAPLRHTCTHPAGPAMVWGPGASPLVTPGPHLFPPHGGPLLTQPSPGAPGPCPHAHTFSPLMKRSFSLRFTWSMERPCSARDSKATVPSGLDTTRPFLPVIWVGEGREEGQSARERRGRPLVSVSLSPCLGPGLPSVCGGDAVGPAPGLGLAPATAACGAKPDLGCHLTDVPGKGTVCRWGGDTGTGLGTKCTQGVGKVGAKPG